ncbi:MAG TPA: RsiV family protein, partial [Pyrinomonadaceae bacterium]|nr:RsiV family protein [Pyrinomonadaceae bacterium]
LISVAFTESTYQRGAAHGNSSTQVINYDLKSKKKLALADLFQDKSKYLSVIASYCQKELKDRAKKPDTMLEPDLFESGAGPRASNYSAWNITRKGLWITFDPYQVAAYAAGPQYILVPYSALSDLIKPDGPIAIYAK